VGRKYFKVFSEALRLSLMDSNSPEVGTYYAPKNCSLRGIKKAPRYIGAIGDR
jgi:hypothetical protein